MQAITDFPALTDTKQAEMITKVKIFKTVVIKVIIYKYICHWKTSNAVHDRTVHCEHSE